ncbi:carboxypeptidase-like regulatory domain-containing protein [Butyricimonas paravirosa]|uniref:carboxypeptidase-like regulatory domain-containing protein n=1 Tax=Butyricimonas paravirosa TaxID=1472417 RepID=UPI002A819760|nr:carboxypeptidase-like regulatory domain-containing protein [Butyricimonas paravirosa]
MRKEFFRIGIFALVVTLSGLIANANQAMASNLVKTTILPKVVLKTSINSTINEVNAVVSISGRVIDQNSDPVAFASILIDNQQTDYSTSTSGYYSIDRISTGSVITFICEGYENTSVKIAKGGTQQDVIMQLQESSMSPRAIMNESSLQVSISGKVIDQNNDPVAFASILIDNQQTDYSTSTSGYYSIDRISTGSIVTFICEGYENTSVKITKGGSQQDVIMQLQESSMSPRAIMNESNLQVSISGKVVDQNSDPVAFASILIDNQQTDYSTSTSGYYSIDRISTGSVVTFICEGYENTSIKITKGGSQQDVIMQLQESSMSPRAIMNESNLQVSISGKVIDQNNDPVAFASILIDNQQTDYSTSTNGYYSIDRISTGSIVTFICEGYENTSVKITKGGNQQDIIMQLHSTSY